MRRRSGYYLQTIGAVSIIQHNEPGENGRPFADDILN